MAEKEKKGGDEKQNIIIKRVKKVGGGHHGGAWKVAYADFVTAMMAFFLLLWLLSVTTNTEKEKIADYFSPTDPRIAQDQSGSGGLLGGTTVSPRGAKTDNNVISQNSPRGNTENAPNSPQKAATLDHQDEVAFKKAASDIRKSIDAVGSLRQYEKNLLIDMTPEGLRIQIIDTNGKPMFAIGSPKPLPQTVQLLSMITGIIKDLPNKVSVRGHTDSIPYGKGADYTNWELSADRANASRRVMLESGFAMEQLHDVQGRADHDPLIAADPASPRNRRLTLLLLKRSLTQAEEKENAKENGKLAAGMPVDAPAPVIRKQEKGVIYFP
ncbi:MAG: flagellar motor protein MotB [Alphaproteobacteria bacterium]|nr:flagellar motor protein MotB [Alphaproteobacteria bacterium]MDE2337057.1 flagellar motor protein MotB [Alphaproteobacteria bacterium]